MRVFFVLALRAYKLVISPFLPPACRFYPSCSEYAAQAISKHGVLRGAALAAGRLVRCHPWHPGGVDHVPLLQATSGARRFEAKPVGHPER